ncbi:hypothetical protein [Micromonospora sp. NPDC005171]|uniref:hypothetical protein n=1 Tax=Micromonospora sp. NPDC005171 TaxID=3156866 RepID=UPI0033A2AA4B
MSSEPPVPTEEQILSALERTGYIFEQRVATLLGPGVSTGWAFKDQDSGASRELDIHMSGQVVGRAPSGTVSIDWTILGECKSYQWPWIALTKSWEDGWTGWDGRNSTDILLSPAARMDLNPNRFTAYDNPDSFFGRYRAARYRSPRAVQLVKLNKKSGGWEAHSGDIFNDLTYPLAKAVSFLREQFDRIHGDFDRDPFPRALKLIFPVIFVSSPMYTVSFPLGKPRVNPTKQIVLERRLSSASVTGDFRFDVVHIDGIEAWYEHTVLQTVRHVVKQAGMEGSAGLISRGD